MKLISNLFASLTIALIGFTAAAHGQDSLPSWNDTRPKEAIIGFVEKVTKEGAKERS
jgi:hypothetical protein